MKNIKIIMLACIMFIGTQSIAGVLKGIDLISLAPVPEAVQTSREIIKELESEPEVKDEAQPEALQEIKNSLTPEMIKDLRTCKPYDEKFDFEIIGINISFKIKIDGWVDEKCTYHISGKVNKIGDEIRNSFGLTVSDDVVAKFEPKVQCGFDKDQLNILVDAVIEEDKRSTEQINSLLKNPEEALMHSAQELTPQEQKLVDMIVEQNVCTIVNQDELMKLFAEFHEKKE